MYSTHLISEFKMTVISILISLFLDRFAIDQFTCSMECVGAHLE